MWLHYSLSSTVASGNPKLHQHFFLVRDLLGCCFLKLCSQHGLKNWRMDAQYLSMDVESFIFHHKHKSLSSQDSEKGFVSFLSCNTETKPEIQQCNPLTSLFFYWSFTEFGSTAIETQVKLWPAVHYVDQTVSDAIFLNTKL